MLWNESSMLISLLGTKVPGNESSTYRTFVPGNESSRVRKFQLPPTSSDKALKDERVPDWGQHAAVRLKIPP